MSLSLKPILIAFAVFLPFAAPANEVPTELFNRDFEQDTDNVGFPDGWKVAKDAEITLTRENVSSGTRALVITKGYAAVSQDLDITNLAGRRVIISVDVCSPDAAPFGLRVGYYVHDEVKGRQWVDAPMIWEKTPGETFETFTAQRVIPKNALDGRFWFCLYRSKNIGTVVVDNISLEFLDESTSLDTRQSTVLQRERDYLLEKLRLAGLKQPERAEWEALRKEADTLRDEAVKGGDFEATLSNFRQLNARLQQAFYGATPIIANWEDGYERLEPTALPAVEAPKSVRLTALSGEVVALGVELANPTLAAQSYSISLGGDVVPAVQASLRRHVLVETWYTKGATLIADPAPLLFQDSDGWKLSLEPGEVTRLHLSMKVLPQDQSANLSGTLTLKTGDHTRALPFVLAASTLAPPREPELGHYQFLYTQQNVVNRVTEAAREDLASHGVTDIEWPFKPSATFSKEGELISTSLGAPGNAHARWLNGFKDSDIRLNLFWMKDLKTSDGEELERYSPAWLRAWKSLVTAYLDYAETLGIPRERFTILPMDEIHSKRLEAAPDQNIKDYIKVAKATAEAEPKLFQYLTIGNYAFPADVKAFTPYVNVAMPHWPRPLKLSRNAPADYDARKDYFENSDPILRAAVKNNSMKLWSYRVQSGRSDNLLTFSRAYPLLAVAHGHTGFGYWAYNVSSGSTWDDTDGKILDYCLIYDGTEEHPLNLRYNVTREEIVPSLRWEAIRAAQQDAQILLYLLALRDEATCPDDLRDEIKALHEEILMIGGEHGYGSAKLTFAAMEKISRQLRDLYIRAASR